MADNIHNRITEKNPRNDALPSAQKAENFDAEGNQQLLGMTQSDRLIYQLVQNNVSYCGNQLGENLQFNSEVLTNVLYDNIYRLLSDKFQEDEFIGDVADKLIEDGCVVKVDDGGSEQKTQPKEEIVETIDPEAYAELKGKIGSAIDLLKANKVNIFKLFSDVDGQISDLNQLGLGDEERRGKEIDDLVSRIKDNNQKMDEHLTSHNETLEEFEERIDKLTKSMRECIENRGKSEDINRGIVEKVKNIIRKICGQGGQQSGENNKPASPAAPTVQPPSSGVVPESSVPPPQKAASSQENIQPKAEKQGTTATPVSPPPAPPPPPSPPKPPTRLNVGGGGGNTVLLPHDAAKTEPGERGNTSFFKRFGIGVGAGIGAIAGFRLFRKGRSPAKTPVKPITTKRRGLFGLFRRKDKKLKIKPRRPTLRQRIGLKFRRTKQRLKQRISNSFLGKGYRAIKKGVKFVAKVITKTVKVVWKTIKIVTKVVTKTIKAAWKVAKFTAKAFLAASILAGAVARAGAKLAWKGLKAAGRTVKKMAVEGVKNVFSARKIGAVLSKFALAPFLTKIALKLGWKSIKWVGKKLWSGIKYLFFKTASLFSHLFKFIGKFVNKVGTWTVKLGAGIMDKSYRFLIVPIAGLIVSVVAFFTGVLMAPIKFMKWLIPSVFDRIKSALANIASAVGVVLRMTWGVIKKILFNPITIALLIGGLLYFIVPKLIGWLSGGWQSIKEKFVMPLVDFAKGAWGFIKKAFDVIVTVGRTVFNIVEYLTKPEGPIAKIINLCIRGYFMFKSMLKWIFKATGKDSIDMLCMFLSGDTIGIIFSLVGGLVKRAWQFLRNLKIFKLIFAYIKAIFAVCKMIATMHITLINSLFSAAWAAVKSVAKFLAGGGIDFSSIVNAFCAPWKKWWGNVKDLFSGVVDAVKDSYEESILTKNPIEINEETAANTGNAVRNLKVKGLTADKNLKWMDQFSNSGKQGAVLERMQKMNDLYQENSKQVGEYENFIHDTWEAGRGNDDASQQALRILLESPDLSQKLLSAFFYYDPATGKTMALRPPAYIGQFVKNIQEMVSKDNVDHQDAFQTLIEAFDQMNKERSHIVNQQGELLRKTAEDIQKLDVNKKKDAEVLKKVVLQINEGSLFKKNIDIKDSFRHMKDKDAKTQEIESVTGRKFGTNSLLKVKELTSKESGGQTGLKDSDFEVKPPPPPPKNQIGNVVIPPAMYPAPMVPPSEAKAIAEGKNIIQLWKEHHDKRRSLLAKQVSEKKVDEMGYRNYTLDEFKQMYNKKHNLTPDNPEAIAYRENQRKRLASMRLAANINAFHSQGQVANVDGFNIGKTPSILKVETENLTQTMYMFSPEWRQVQGASQTSDAELLGHIKAQDSAEAAKLRKAKEEELKKKEEEEAKKRREQQILDYSAKITEDGYIEVKMGEDVDAMMDAWKKHMDKRREAQANQISDDKLDEMGLKNYTWEEWKKYYRKMHGMPEDGIKRIPINAKKSERKIDWEERFPLSAKELGKYGIEVSKEGPVMIPLDKAMEITNALLQEAKTIYSVRDGLEVMRNGLDSETKNLQKRRDGGSPFAVVGGDSSDQQPATQPAPPDQSHYAQVG